MRSLFAEFALDASGQVGIDLGPLPPGRAVLAKRPIPVFSGDAVVADHAAVSSGRFPYCTLNARGQVGVSL